MSNRIVIHAWGGGSRKIIKKNPYSNKSRDKDTTYKIENLDIWFDRV